MNSETHESYKQALDSIREAIKYVSDAEAYIEEAEDYDNRTFWKLSTMLDDLEDMNDALVLLVAEDVEEEDDGINPFQLSFEE